MAPKVIDLSGKRFGRLVVTGRAENNPEGRSIWMCTCDCGNKTEVSGTKLRNKNTQSCGCQRVLSATKHGEHNTLTYRSWCSMKSRCCNPANVSYERYGGRNIKICQRWLDSFANFLEDMGKRPSREYTLDRKNVNGNYEKSNCKWSDKIEQRSNRRDSRVNI